MTRGPAAEEISWAEFDELCLRIAAELEAQLPALDLLVAIARGGLVPAVKLSHHIGCRAVAVIDARRSRSDRVRDLPPDGLWMAAGSLPDRAVSQIAIVDDVIGHGHTLVAANALVAERWPGARRFSVALVDDTNLVRSPSFAAGWQYFAARELRAADWVVFPWERRPA